MLLAVVCVVSLLLAGGLALTGLSAQALIDGASMRQLLDRLVGGHPISPGAGLVAASVGITLVAPIAALIAVVVFGAKDHRSPLRSRHVILALGAVTVTAVGVMLAFL